MATGYRQAGVPYNSHLNYRGLPPLVTAAELPTLGLFATRKSDGHVSPLPEAIIDQMSFEASSPSAISFTCLPGTKGYDHLGDYTIIDLRMNGVPVKDGRWLLRLGNWNEAQQGKPKTFQGRHLLWDRLDKTRIWNVPGVIGSRYIYTKKTIGFILNDIFQEAKNRGVGYWSNFTWDFDQASDSDGHAWPETIDIEYLPTAKYSDIVTNLVDRGLIEISLVNNEIFVTSAGYSGRPTSTLLVVGEDVTDAPQQSSADNIVSHVLMLGDDGVTVERSNAGTAATYWREEDGISQGGTKDIGTLTVLGDVALSNGDGPRIQRSYGLVLNHLRRYLPIRDYEVQDWVGGVCNALTIPVFGTLSDRFGRRVVYGCGVVLALVLTLVFFPMLDTRSATTIILAIAAALTIHAMMYGPQAAFIAEQFPTRVRYAGASLAYTFAGIVGGGIAPLMFAALLKIYGTTYVIAAYTAVALVITGAVLWIARERAGQALD